VKRGKHPRGCYQGYLKNEGDQRQVGIKGESSPPKELSRWETRGVNTVLTIKKKKRSPTLTEDRLNRKNNGKKKGEGTRKALQIRGRNPCIVERCSTKKGWWIKKRGGLPLGKRKRSEQTKPRRKKKKRGVSADRGEKGGAFICKRHGPLGRTKTRKKKKTSQRKGALRLGGRGKKTTFTLGVKLLEKSLEKKNTKPPMGRTAVQSPLL